MRSKGRAITARAAAAAGTCALSVALTLGAAQAQDQTFLMKISTPTLHAGPDRYADNYAAAIEKASGGRIKAQVYPASQLGSIPRQIEGTQFDAIQCEVAPPEFFVGVDKRFEIMAAPGLVSSMQQGERVAADPQVRKLMLGLGADKGLHGVGLFMGEPSELIFKSPARHLADFKGKKVRIFASEFQSRAFERLGITPVAMTLGDVLPAVQQGAIDGAVAGMQVFGGMHYIDAAKFITMTGQPSIFIIAEVNRKWYESLPPDLQQTVDRVGASESATIEPQVEDLTTQAKKGWVANGGELIDLPAAEQEQMLKIVSSVGEDVSQSNPQLHAAYELVTGAAERLKVASGR
jgi:TRAP-type C4-dicarboxylate transport system substrate-binding protein